MFFALTLNCALHVQFYEMQPVSSRNEDETNYLVNRLARTSFKYFSVYYSFNRTHISVILLTLPRTSAKAQVMVKLLIKLAFS